MLLVLVAGCHWASPTGAELPAVDPTEQPLETLQVDVLTVQPVRWPTIVRSQGTLVADEITAVGSKVAGPVAEVHVDLGDVVQQGSPLATLDQRQFRLQVEQAQAQLAQARSAIGLQPDEAVDQLKPENAPPVRQEQAIWEEAKANLERGRRLRTENVITLQEYDQLVAAERVGEARYASALNGVYEKISLIHVREAELSLAQEQLRDAVITAPFDGMIQVRRTAPGTYVQIGDPIVTLVRTNPLRFRGTMPERHAQFLAIGQQVRLLVESSPDPIMVQVTRISPSLDQLTRALMFETLVDNGEQRFRTGLFAEAEVLVHPQAEALAVPRSSVVEFAGVEKVWKVVDGISTSQEVLTGQRRETKIEILQGLTAGDVILVHASQGRVARIEPRMVPLDAHSITGWPSTRSDRQIVSESTLPAVAE